jgi:hypothetical protein
MENPYGCSREVANDSAPSSTRRELAQLALSPGTGVHSAIFLASGHVLAAGEDGSVSVWGQAAEAGWGCVRRIEADAGSPPRPLHGGAAVLAIREAIVGGGDGGDAEEAGPALVTGGGDGRVRFWTLVPGELEPEGKGAGGEPADAYATGVLRPDDEGLSLLELARPEAPEPCHPPEPPRAIVSVDMHEGRADEVLAGHEGLLQFCLPHSRL